ncbi:MAG: Hsp20/alpha crystallin family protein [Chloroflexota bacterium]
MVERWTPLFDMERMMNEMDRFFADRPERTRTSGRSRSYRPAMDVYDSGESIVVKALIPGATPDDLDISLEQNTLTIKGTLGYQLTDEQARQVTWYQREIGFTDWAETVQLPTPVDSENASAEFENGILTLTLPKAEQARVKRIPVQSNRQLQGQN